MKKLNLKLKNNRKGITLIALVITIIVLLILAGVSIATLTGKNGILTRATEASEKTEEAKEDELRRLTALEAAMNTEGTTHTDNSRNEGVQETVPIPAGFAVSQVEGENTIANGLVIIDKNGNEFVWVPVDNIENFKLIDDYKNGELNDWVKNKKVQEPFKFGYDTEIEEYNQMKMSVELNKGFYVGRYESGTLNNSERTSSSGIDEDVIIKKGAYVYNYIPWSNSNDMSNEDGGAVEKSKSFCIENGYTAVTSTLIYGVQWDAIMQWFDSEYKTGNCDVQNSYVANSMGKGNYKINDSISGISTTGSNELYKIKNIYDMAGNVSEWTMESYISLNRVRRGGSYKNDPLGFPASRRNADTQTSLYDNVGFRIALYLNEK